MKEPPQISDPLCTTTQEKRSSSINSVGGRDGEDDEGGGDGGGGDGRGDDKIFYVYAELVDLPSAVHTPGSSHVNISLL